MTIVFMTVIIFLIIIIEIASRGYVSFMMSINVGGYYSQSDTTRVS